MTKRIIRATATKGSGNINIKQRFSITNDRNLMFLDLPILLFTGSRYLPLG